MNLQSLILKHSLHCAGLDTTGVSEEDQGAVIGAEMAPL
jgi:hypothetical protein